MKSSLKPFKLAMYLFSLGSVLMVFYLFGSIHQAGEVIGIGRMIAGGLVIPLSSLVGYVASQILGTNFHRVVDHPVTPDSLVEGQTYWLNGETWSKCYGRDADSGEYRFGIWGRNDLSDPTDYELISPWRVHTFIAFQQEVFN